MSGNRIAEIRKKFQNNGGGGGGFVPTPENQFGKMKKSKEANARAIRVAKARAARYNMTLRALAIKTHTDTSKMQRNGMSKKKEAKKAQSKYKATSRGLAVPTSLGAKEKMNIAKALDSNVDPSLAKDVLDVVATRNHQKEAEAQAKLRRASRKPRTVVKPAPVPKHVEEEEEDVKTDDEEEEAPVPTPTEKKVNKPVAETQEEPAASVEEEAPKKIKMNTLQDALKTGDERAINKAILLGFLTSHAPHMAGQADQLLDKFSESLDDFFQKLMKQFPSGADMEVAGQQKADKEIADAVEAGDKKVPENIEAALEEDSDDDSFVMDETAIDKLEEDKPKPKAKPAIKVEDFTLDDDDDNSMVELQDEKVEETYQKTMRKAEKSELGVVKSLARRRTTLKAGADLQAQLTGYKEEARKSFKSVQTLEEEGPQEDDDDSLVQDADYIIELEENKEEEAPVRWAVQFQNKNQALKDKLLKQGLTQDQVTALVDDLDNNTSEML